MHKRSPFRACSGKGRRPTYSRTFVQWLEASPPLFELGLGSYGGQSSPCDISQRRLGVWQQGPGSSRGLYPLEHAAEVAPSSPVIACGGGSRRNDTRSGRCLRSAEIMAEFVCDVGWQIFHARRCGYEILKCVNSSESDRCHSRDASSAMALSLHEPLSIIVADDPVRVQSTPRRTDPWVETLQATGQAIPERDLYDQPSKVTVIQPYPKSSNSGTKPCRSHVPQQEKWEKKVG